MMEIDEHLNTVGTDTCVHCPIPKHSLHVNIRAIDNFFSLGVPPMPYMHVANLHGIWYLCYRRDMLPQKI